MDELRIYILLFDRAGYGESDPNPKRSLKSEASDIDELADLMQLGSKYYVIGVSLGCYAVWSCLKRTPQRQISFPYLYMFVCLSVFFELLSSYILWGNCRLAGVAMIVPIINYKWRSLPNELTKDDYRKNLCRWIIWLLRHTPGLLHWWLTQKFFPSANVLDHSPAFFNNKDLDSLRNTPGYQLFTQVIFITAYYILLQIV